MNAAWTSLGLALMVLGGTARAGEPAPGWKWDAPPAVAAPQPQPATPACDDRTDKPSSPPCAAKPATADDGLEDSLAPPAASVPSGNRQIRKAQ